MAIKAIQTNYKGYHFRSRLEARWAVFFDALGLQWEYEPEGFDLGDAGWYLPDFRVTSPQGYVAWYEVKPKDTPSDLKLDRLQEVFVRDSFGYEQFTTSFVLLAGDPYEFLTDAPAFMTCPRCFSIGDLNCDPWANDVAYYWCMPCGHRGGDSGIGWIETTRYGVKVKVHNHFLVVGEGFNAHYEIVRQACTAARSARFEHGETPK